MGMKDICADKANVLRDTSLVSGYLVHIPDKYDFTSAAGLDKMQEGLFVLDSDSKRVVPLNQCNWSCKSPKDEPDNVAKKIASKLARSG